MSCIPLYTPIDCSRFVMQSVVGWVVVSHWLLLDKDLYDILYKGQSKCTTSHPIIKTLLTSSLTLNLPLPNTFPMFSKMITIILLTSSVYQVAYGLTIANVFIRASSVCLGVLAAPVPVGQIPKRGCMFQRGAACLRDVADTAAIDSFGVEMVM